ncbi:MAG: hypothetical protein ACREPW_07605, partial [Candidatus Binataceae bacterium]
GKESVTRLDQVLKSRAKEWQVAPADLERALRSVEDLLRLIESGGHADGALSASIAYDDFDLIISISYKGTLPYIASSQKLPNGMVEEQIFAVGLSGYLSSVVPDRLDSSCDSGQCVITMYFEG